MKNNKGFTLIELLVSMAVAGVIMTAALTIFDAGVKTKMRQVDTINLKSNIRVAMDYIKEDIAQAGAFFGDQGYFNYYNPGGTDALKKFCVDFDSQLWPDYNNLKEAWEGLYKGWTLDDYGEDMVEIWYGDSDIFTKIYKSVNITNLIDFDISDNPDTLGFIPGDYVAFYDSSKDSTTTNDYIKGATSSSNWVTVLIDGIPYPGETVRGQVSFQGNLTYNDPFRTPYGYNICTTLGEKTVFESPDRLHKVHRIVYGVVQKSVNIGGTYKTLKMLIRDNFRDITGASRFNPQIVATNIEQFKLSTIFRIPKDEAGTRPTNYYNSVVQGLYYNSPGKMFAIDLQTALTTDKDNLTQTDFDPRDLRKIQVEILGISTKKYADQASEKPPKIYFTPDMGVIADSDSDVVRYPGMTYPDWYKHSRIVTQIGLRALRIKDFAVSPE